MKFEKKTVYRAGSIFIVSVVISIAVFLSDRGAGLERNQNGQVVLLREEHGKGNKTEELEAENQEMTVKRYRSIYQNRNIVRLRLQMYFGMRNRNLDR